MFIYLAILCDIVEVITLRMEVEKRRTVGEGNVTTLLNSCRFVRY